MNFVWKLLKCPNCRGEWTPPQNILLLHCPFCNTQVVRALPINSFVRKVRLSKCYDYKKLTTNDFMNFFRDNDKVNELSADDRVEIFSTILPGNSDFTKELLDDILSDYDVWHLKVIDLNDDKQKSETE